MISATKITGIKRDGSGVFVPVFFFSVQFFCLFVVQAKYMMTLEAQKDQQAGLSVRSSEPLICSATSD